MRGRTVAVWGTLAVLLAGSATWAVVDARHRADEAERRAQAARDEVEDLRAELEDLRERQGGGDPLGDILGGLLGGEPGAGGLEDLLGEGNLGDLLGEGGLDGLLGSGGLDGLLGDGGGDLVGCIGGGDLGGLLGGGGPGGGQDGAGGASRSDQIEAVTQAVVDIRELELREPVTPTFLAPDDLRARVAELIDESYPAEQADADGRVLAMLGAVPEGTDMRALLGQALSEQVAGFYVPETGELVVSEATGDSLTAVARVTLAHEIQHAIADQHFGLPRDRRPDPARADADLAQHSLIEGDATVTMQRYALEHLSLGEQFTMLSDPGMLASQSDLDALPHHISRSITFPYLDGMQFVCSLYSDGGWTAVDRAYASPPATTAQVLFPDRYQQEEAAVDPPDPQGLPAPWSERQVGSFGAAELLWLLEAPGGDSDRAVASPRDAVAEWAGGKLTLYTRGDDSAVALVLADRDGGAELCSPVVAWARAAWTGASEAPVGGAEVVLDGASRDVAVACTGGTVRVGVGPDPEVARALSR